MGSICFVVVGICKRRQTGFIRKVSIRYSLLNSIRTPYGLGWSECTHEGNVDLKLRRYFSVPSGTHIIEGEDGSVRTSSRYLIWFRPNSFYQMESIRSSKSNTSFSSSLIYARCPMPFLRNGQQPKDKAKRDYPDDGWQVWSAFNNINNATFTAFLGSFNVPDDPGWSESEGGILYMFTGLQNDNWVPIPNEWNTPPYFDIIQPVLQYGPDSSSGGGNYWALASWYVTLDCTYRNTKWMVITTSASIVQHCNTCKCWWWNLWQYDDDSSKHLVYHKSMDNWSTADFVKPKHCFTKSAVDQLSMRQLLCTYFYKYQWNYQQ